MPHRDPQTGRFVADASRFDHVEYQSFNVVFSVPAADLAGTTSQFYGEEGRFEGLVIYDADEFLDRHEVGELVLAQHKLDLQPTGTQTADSAARMGVEVSASPARLVVGAASDAAIADIDDTAGDFAVEANVSSDDTQDILGRPLMAMAQGPFTDGTAGLGGGGGPGWDSLEFVPENWVFDRRDNMFCNGVIEAQNIADGPVTAQLSGQHVWGIVAE